MMRAHMPRNIDHTVSKCVHTNPQYPNTNISIREYNV